MALKAIILMILGLIWATFGINFDKSGLSIFKQSTTLFFSVNFSHGSDLIHFVKFVYKVELTTPHIILILVIVPILYFLLVNVYKINELILKSVALMRFKIISVTLLGRIQNNGWCGYFLYWPYSPIRIIATTSSHIP